GRLNSGFANHKKQLSQLLIDVDRSAEAAAGNTTEAKLQQALKTTEVMGDLATFLSNHPDLISILELFKAVHVAKDQFFPYEYMIDQFDKGPLAFHVERINKMKNAIGVIQSVWTNLNTAFPVLPKVTQSIDKLNTAISALTGEGETAAEKIKYFHDN